MAIDCSHCCFCLFACAIALCRDGCCAADHCRRRSYWGGPLALWITDGFFLQRNYRIESLYIAISLDVIFVSICAILYYLRRPPLSAPLMVVVLLIHFTICVWMTKGYTDILSCFSAYHQRLHSWERTFATCSIWIAFRTGFPVVGFLSAVLWVFYVRRMPDHFRPSSFPKPTVV
jgi:hypothetical protein